MKSCTFIRGLFGELSGPATAQKMRAKVWTDIETTIRKYRQPGPVVNYVFGVANHAELSLLTDCERLNDAPLVNWEGRPGPRDTFRGKDAGRLAWGLSVWRHKLECLRTALQRHRAVVWLDWDSHLLRDLPADFWARMAKGAPIQAVLRMYEKVQCGWRSRDRRILPHGAFIYCRDPKLIERAIEVQRQHPTWTDEHALAFVMDEIMAGWKGREHYKAAGFEPFCATTRRAIHRPPAYLLFSEGLERGEAQMIANARVRENAPVRVRFVADHLIDGRRCFAGTARNLRLSIAKNLVAMGIVEPLRRRDREMVKEAA